MRKSKKVLIVFACLAVLLLSIIFGYTYSKYVYKEPVSGSASVAKWSFSGAISNSENKTTKSISLADTMNSSDSITKGKIAPGTSGSFKIIVNAAGSEVDVDYDVLLASEESQKPKNLYFKCNDLVEGSGQKFYSLAEMLKVNEETQRSNMSGKITTSQNEEPKEITVEWEWPYESTDESGVKQQEQLDEQDTNDSKLGDYTFTLNIVGTQAK